MEMTLKMLETGFVNLHGFLSFSLSHIRITLHKSNVNSVNKNSIFFYCVKIKILKRFAKSGATCIELLVEKLGVKLS